MDPLSAMGSVIACAQLAFKVGGLCYGYAQDVNNAEVDSRRLFSRLHIFQDSLQDVQKLLWNEGIPQDDERYPAILLKTLNSHSYSVKSCEELLIKIQDKLLEAQTGSKFKKMAHKLKWPIKKDQAEKALNVLEGFSDAVDKALEMDVFVVGQRTMTISNETKAISNQTLSNTVIIESRQRQRDQDRKDEEGRRQAREIREKILDWLAHPDPSKIHNTVSQARKSEGTGRWFLDGAAYRKFKEVPQSFLWLHGDSGRGKSVLCSAVINDLRAIQHQRHRISLAYWYFSVNDAERRTLQNFLRALLTQLTTNFAAPHSLVNFWEANDRGRITPRDSDLFSILQDMYKDIVVSEGPTTFFVVIDALDESSESDREKVLDTLKQVLSLDGIDIRLFVTSRSTTGVVQQGWHDAVRISEVVLPRQIVDQDILIHINDRLQNDGALKKWSSNLHNDIRRGLTKNAAGVFRWADCQLQAIRRCRKPFEVKKALDSLPKDLKESYTKEIGSIEDDAVEDVRRLLAWLAYSEHP